VATYASASALRFEVSLGPGLLKNPQDGRLFVVLANQDAPEPRLLLGRNGPDAPEALALDVKALSPGNPVVFDEAAFAYPQTNLAAVPPGDYFVQALFDWNRDLRLAAAPENLYSAVLRTHLNPKEGGIVKLELSKQIPPEALPPDTDQVKCLKLQSKLLSDFHHRPIYLRAGVVLPRDYTNAPARRYPLWVQIGGFGDRFTSVKQLMSGGFRGFRSVWQAEDTPQFILLQLDGAGPLGDPYYVNSANNGPYGDALVQELIPYVEQKFRGIGQPRARVLSGTSTGGWVSLALQIFYPDFFNGTWSSCPDPVDFRAFELVNIYSDDYAYSNRHGNERPSERDLKGDVVLTMRREVGVENLLGRGNSYTLSGQQWGSWNAVYSPRGADGVPALLWDPLTGKIDHAVAERWKKYDLRLFVEENWKTLGPKLRGKLHIASGEADEYFLNNAMHMLNDFLTKAEPPFEGKIVFGPGKGHGWMYEGLREILGEMQSATQEKER
jgi:hypothetical protein